MSGSERQLRVVIIGWGAIARRIASLLTDRVQSQVCLVGIALREGSVPSAPLPEGVPVIRGAGALKPGIADLIVEAAGREAVSEWGEAALKAAPKFAIASASALTDDRLLKHLIALAERTGGQILLPPGALAGMDALSAASLLKLDDVEHVIAKPPSAWKGTRAEDFCDLVDLQEATTFYNASARETAAAFPKNANVAVIAAFAGVGLDKTRIRLVADPALKRNSHAVHASGAFGHLDVKIENAPLADNPKSSELTALSLLRMMENEISPLRC